MASNSEYVAGLRDLADWLEAHPEVELASIRAQAYPADTVAMARVYALAMKPCRKDYSKSLFELKRDFGAVEMHASFWRSTVCEKVVTTREVTNLVPDPSVEVPLVEVTETVEDVEWVCLPVLAELEEVAS